MKKILFTVIIASVLLLTSNMVKAQAWGKASKVFTLGLGISQFYHIDSYYYENFNNIRNWYSPVTGQINLQAEFGIHKYVGLGFSTGIGTMGRSSHGYLSEINIPIGMIANFHFYQLIADKTLKNIHADRLDIYFGANLGSGIAIYNYSDYTRLVPMFFGGAHFGVRYYFTPDIGLNCEVGIGKSLANIGFVFKL
jgi:hypothetical protein